VIDSSSPFKYLRYLMEANFRVLVRTRRSLIISLLLPLLLLVVWNNKGTLKAFGGSLFVLAIVMTIAIMSLSIFGYALSVSRDREKGVFQRLRLTPAPTWTIMVSRILVQEISNLVIALLVLIFGSHLYHVSLGAEDYVLAILIALLGGAVFLSIAQTIVALIKSADSVNGVARLVYIVMMLFGLLGLSGALGNLVEAIAKWSPFGAVITIFEGMPHLGSWGVHNSLALLTCFGYIVVFGFIGIKWFRWESN
jgi:ABC-2 type transport system permease protein